MAEISSSFLVEEKLSILMRKYSVPCIISLVTGALYNIVDQIFIANASYLGSCGNAANTVVFPLTIVALAIGVMIGDGACAFVSMSLGSKENKKADKTVGNAIVLCLGASFLITGFYLVFGKQLVVAFGGAVNPETFGYSCEYLFWITTGIPFYMFGHGLNPIIRSDSSPKTAMLATITGALVNMVLDPVFIFIFRWGMMGAALATVAGQIVTASFTLWYFCRMKLISLDKSSFRLDVRLWGKFIPLGICSFLSQISVVASMAAVNNMIWKYGALDRIFGQPEYAQIPMAVVGIVMKFFQIVISIAVGMSAGCIPVAGFNIGAGCRDRAKRLFLMLLAYEAALGAIALAIVEIFPGRLIAVFGASGESVYYTLFAEKAFRIYLCMIIAACVNKAVFIYFQALGKAFLSTALSVIREVVFGVGFTLLLPVFFGLDGVLYSMPMSDILTFAISAGAVVYTCRELSTPGQSL